MLLTNMLMFAIIVYMVNHDVSGQPMNAPQMDSRPFDQDAPYDQDTDQSFMFDGDSSANLHVAEIVEITPHLERMNEKRRIKTVLSGASDNEEVYDGPEIAGLLVADEQDSINLDSEKQQRLRYEEKIAVRAGLGAIVLAGAFVVTNRFENVGYNITHPSETISLGRELVRYVFKR